MASIHRIVFRRLLAAWVAVSLLVGGVAYYIEIEKIDDAVVALAASQAEQFAPEGLDTGRHSPEQLKRLETQAREFVERNFVVIEVYDRNEQKILEAVNPKFAHIEERLQQYQHRFPHHAASRYEKFAIGHDTVVQVLVPLPSKQGDPAGYFEGVFVVDRAVLQQFNEHLGRTLVAALAAVLVTTILLYPVIIALNRHVLRFSREVLKGNLEMASVLGAAIAQRDSDTGDHNFRVTLYAIRLGEAVGLPATDMRHLILGAFLHDVGKIGISDNILLKPARLTEEEFAIMRTHVALGLDIVDQSEWLQGAREVIQCHHEKFDGSGYLQGLRGEAIPLNARIFAIVDVFDALTSKRPYKDPMPLDSALSILKKDAGSHFDPALVDHFTRLAHHLYEKIGQADEKTLEAMLRKEASSYFLRASLGASQTRFAHLGSHHGD